MTYIRLINISPAITYTPSRKNVIADEAIITSNINRFISTLFRKSVKHLAKKIINAIKITIGIKHSNCATIIPGINVAEKHAKTRFIFDRNIFSVTYIKAAKIR